MERGSAFKHPFYNVEINIEKSKNITISCVYRTPESCLDTFNNKMVGMYNNMNDNKMLCVCRDWNVDLLNPSEHKNTTDYIDTMYSLGLFSHHPKTILNIM